jgi:hypothetical protein
MATFSSRRFVSRRSSIDSVVAASNSPVSSSAISSSAISTSGAGANATAIAARCASPPES